MKWIRGWDRQQVHPLPERLEDYVGADNPVRLIEAFVESLDLRAAGFRFPKEDPKGRGRPAYHPAVLLQLYLYGYLQQIRASRRLEAECQRNLEVMWLLGKLAPDFKTIADFRKHNAAAFKAVAREFVRVCQELELIGGQLLAVDGTKVKAQNAADQNWTQSKVEKQLAQVEERLQAYLEAVEQADRAEGPLPVAASAGALQEKIARLRQRRTHLEERLQELQKQQVSEVSLTDADSRGMKSQGHHQVSYNVQGVVDAKHHVLVVAEASQAAHDQGQLAPMAQATQSQLGLQRAEVVADGGYYRSEDIKACQDAGLEPYVAPVHNSPSERARRYGKADFRFDPQQDVSHCPAGAQLPRARSLEDKGRELFHYVNRSACAHCQLKGRCTPAAFRTISRWAHEERLERMAAAVRAAPEKLAQRKTLIEHCWGSLKWLLPGGFLVRGLERVQAEVSLAHFAYNLKRAVGVLGWEKLLRGLQKRSVGRLRVLARCCLRVGQSLQAAVRRLRRKNRSGTGSPPRRWGCFSHRLFTPLHATQAVARWKCRSAPVLGA